VVFLRVVIEINFLQWREFSSTRNKVLGLLDNAAGPLGLLLNFTDCTTRVLPRLAH